MKCIRNLKACQLMERCDGYGRGVRGCGEV